jgi:hypothetical protein
MNVAVVGVQVEAPGGVRDVDIAVVGGYREVDSAIQLTFAPAWELSRDANPLVRFFGHQFDLFDQRLGLVGAGSAVGSYRLDHLDLDLAAVDSLQIQATVGKDYLKRCFRAEGNRIPMGTLGFVLLALDEGGSRE